MKNCLVVDDSSVIRKVARRILEGLEFQIAEAEDGELRHEPLGPVDRGAGFLADLELRRQRSLGRLPAGAAAQAAGAVDLADLAAGALRPIRARKGRPARLGKGHGF